MEICPEDELFLDMLQGELDDETRSELDDHLDTCPACAALVVDLAELLFPEDDDALPEDEPDTLGRYALRRIVGSGGMGMVYEAWDPELRRRVALKVLRTDLLHPSVRADCQRRLRREAQLMAALSHPNVLPVFEIGEDRDQVFVALEFVEGRSVDDWLEDSGPHPWRRIVEVFVEAGRGLAAAHDAGLIHRDVKPANMLLADSGRVFVMDFGLGRAADRPPEPRGVIEETMAPVGLTVLTNTGALLGTPAYMAPEQHLGMESTPRTDQFSFCMSLYEALLGVRPFEGNTREDLSINVCSGNLRERPDAESWPDPDMPETLLAVLERGLAPRADDRHEDMHALLLALDPLLTAPRQPAAPPATKLAFDETAPAAQQTSPAPSPSRQPAPPEAAPVNAETPQRQPDAPTSRRLPVILFAAVFVSIGGSVVINQNIQHITQPPAPAVTTGQTQHTNARRPDAQPQADTTEGTARRPAPGTTGRRPVAAVQEAHAQHLAQQQNARLLGESRGAYLARVATHAAAGHAAHRRTSHRKTSRKRKGSRNTGGGSRPPTRKPRAVAARAPSAPKPRPALTTGPDNTHAEANANALRASKMIRLGALGKTVQAAVKRRDGKRCMKDLKEAYRLLPGAPNEAIVRRTFDMHRGYCLMLVGRCDAGEDALTRFYTRYNNQPHQSAQRTAQRVSETYCTGP